MCWGLAHIYTLQPHGWMNPPPNLNLLDTKTRSSFFMLENQRLVMTTSSRWCVSNLRSPSVHSPHATALSTQHCPMTSQQTSDWIPQPLFWVIFAQEAWRANGMRLQGRLGSSDFRKKVHLGIGKRIGNLLIFSQLAQTSRKKKSHEIAGQWMKALNQEEKNNESVVLRSQSQAPSELSFWRHPVNVPEWLLSEK